ncbi:hypothetical protein V1477_010627 [Vespula maculifrons]|uniref:Uncharacterized protein n=1 Tax=Vespula maculifrons TaxID=7453 RepID=A0ABD2C2G4_VESMC
MDGYIDAQTNLKMWFNFTRTSKVVHTREGPTWLGKCPLMYTLLYNKYNLSLYR